MFLFVNMSCTRAAGFALFFILCSAFWKGSDSCAVNVSVTGAPVISVSEQQSYVQITLTRDNATSAITVMAYPHIATVTNGSDVILSNMSFVFPVNMTSASTNITLLPDQFVEHTETFFIQLVTTDVGVCIVNNNITVHITNDDRVELNFLYRNMTVEENKGYISIPVNKTGLSRIPVNFRLTMDEKPYSTATRGDDYQDRHGNVIRFPASDQQMSTMYVNVSIKMDGKAESSEVFVVGLEAVDSGTATIGAMNSMVVKITDQKDNDDYEAKERQRQKDEDDAKKQKDTLLILLYVTVALVALALIIFFVICVVVIRRLRK